MRHESDIPGVPGHFADLVNGLRRELFECHDRYRELSKQYLMTKGALVSAESGFYACSAAKHRMSKELATYHRELLATKAALAQAEGERDYYRNMAEELAR